MKQTNILDLESIERLIKSNNLKELSEKTGIPYDTLKNYSSGRTDIESISYRNLTLLNEYYEREFLGKLEFANVVVAPLVFDKLVDKYRDGYNPYYEMVILYYEYLKRVEDYKKKHSKVVFFIDFSIFYNKLYQVEKSQIDNLVMGLGSVISTGLVLGIMIVFKNVPEYSNDIINNNSHNIVNLDDKLVMNLIGRNATINDDFYDNKFGGRDKSYIKDKFVKPYNFQIEPIYVKKLYDGLDIKFLLIHGNIVNSVEKIINRVVNFDSKLMTFNVHSFEFDKKN
jgi:hypothetical protein